MAQADYNIAASEREITLPSNALAVCRPFSTYRPQFPPSFTFADAACLVPYLHALGISDCYASPYFNACPGSPHGYDVIDHNALNPELGGEAAYETFIQELQRYDMGQLLDIVPNHIGIAKSQNPWWTDVLENGPSSLYASCFDIYWAPVKEELANKVLLPILGDQYGRVLENQELTLSYEDGAFLLSYYDHRLPIAPRPATAILLHRLGAEHAELLEFRSIITALGHLPLRTETDRDKVIERHREKEIIKKRLAVLTSANPTIRVFVEDNVRFFNGVKGDQRSFNLLDTLLGDQGYRLAYWRVAAEEINYRRFFDINELAAIRTEDPIVFAAIHQLVLRLIAEGKVTGLRIDHVDGLYNPVGYLRRLQQAVALALQSETYTEVRSLLSRADQLAFQSQVESAPLSGELPCYVVVEKILSEGEALPEHWPMHGSTGYDFLAILNGIFVDRSNERAMTDLYARFTRTHEDTAFYRYHRLVSLNEVGGPPGQFGVSLATFHRQNQERLRHWPSGLLATSTHDTKRSEDVRARINVLSELPHEWHTLVGRWSRQCRKRKIVVDGHPAPDHHDEYLFYQTVLGVWPFSAMTADDYAVFKQRIQAYMRKAAKEAKVHTSWINPNQAYDDVLQEFVSRVLDDFLFREDFQRFRTKIAQYGMYNSLSQTLLKLTAPGVPDIYQGNELWDFSLVDPDSRRPVEYDRRHVMLQAPQERIASAGVDLRAFVRELLDHREDRRVKLYVTHRALSYRRKHQDVFLRGEAVLIVAPRLLTQVIPDPTMLPLGPEVWSDSWLLLPSDWAHRRHQNVFTGETVTAVTMNGGLRLALSEVFASFPVALLAATDAPQV